VSSLIRAASSCVSLVNCVFCPSRSINCSRLRGGELLGLDARLRQRLSVRRVGVGVGLVAVSLPRLRQQDQRRGVSRLQAEGQVQENEWVRIEVRDPDQIDHHPAGDDPRLDDQVRRGDRSAGQPAAVGAAVRRPVARAARLSVAPGFTTTDGRRSRRCFQDLRVGWS
jgi:hypothetical protein